MDAGDIWRWACWSVRHYILSWAMNDRGPALYELLDLREFDKANQIAAEHPFAVNGQVGGIPLIQQAIRDRSTEAVKWLIRRGAVVDYVDPAGYSLLDSAVVIGDAAIITHLIDAGAQPHQTTWMLSNARNNHDIWRILQRADKGRLTN